MQNSNNNYNYNYSDTKHNKNTIKDVIDSEISKNYNNNNHSNNYKSNNSNSNNTNNNTHHSKNNSKDSNNNDNTNSYFKNTESKNINVVHQHKELPHKYKHKTNLKHYFTVNPTNNNHSSSNFNNNNMNNSNDNNLYNKVVDNNISLKTDEEEEVYKRALNIKENINKLINENTRKQTNKTKQDCSKITKKYSEGQLNSTNPNNKKANSRTKYPISNIPEGNLFKPIINEKSKQMAKNIEPIMVRTFSNKNTKKKSSSDKIVKTEPTSKSPNPRSSPVKFELYEKALKTRKKLEEYRKEIQKEDNDYLISVTPFKPKLYKNKQYSKSPSERYNKTTQLNKTQENIDLYTRQKKWQSKVENKVTSTKNEILSENSVFYPFKPNMDKKVIMNNEDDEKLLQRNMTNNLSYIDRRQASLRKQKDDEEYAKKIFGYGDNYHKLKNIKPQKINVTFNDSESFIQKLKNARQRSPSLSNMRDFLGVGSFFEKSNTNDIETNNKKDLKNGYCNESIGESVNNNDFVKALTNLQKNLKNLKL